MNKIRKNIIHTSALRYAMPPLLVFAALLGSPICMAATYEMSGTYSFSGARNAANGDVYFVDSSSSSQLSTFLVSQPDKNFWVYGLIPNYPTSNDYHLIYKAYIYTYTPDRPSWLASEITTWAAPVEFVPSSTVAPGNFRLNTSANTFSILSSDAYDADGKRRVDTANINWAVLNFDGVYTSGAPFLHLQGVTANDITLDLEHVIFKGSKNVHAGNAGQGIGGGLIRATIGAARTLTIKGDVGFVNNMGNNGGVLMSNGSVVFEGNVFFDGNIGGVLAPSTALQDENGLFTEQAAQNPHFEMPEYTFTRNDAAAGTIRLQASNLSLTFKQTALFTNNVGGGEAGNILLGGGTTQGYKLLFQGNVAFFGNIAGFVGKTAGPSGTGPGRGGAITYLHGGGNAFSEGAFDREAIFIANRATGGGGAIANMQQPNSNVALTFNGRAIFTDNSAGRENRKEPVIAVATEALLDYIGQDAYFPNVIADGGAITHRGGTDGANGGRSIITFHGDTLFGRNSALGDGGAIAHLGSAGGIVFDHNATLSNNTAGTLLVRTYTTNTLGAISNLGSIEANGGAISSQVDLIFNGGNNGQLVAGGNIAYFTATGTSAELAQITGGRGGAIYSVGGNAWVQINQQYSFTNNQAGGGGGAIHATGAFSGLTLTTVPRTYSLELTKSGRFVNNLASGSTSYGGAIYANSVLVTSGARFEDNAAGGFGGAIFVTGMSGTGAWSMPRITLRAETDDIIFTGNRHGVTTDESTLDFEKILSTSATATGGYITKVDGSGKKNDINFSIASGTAAVVSGTLEFIVEAGRKIYFDGGISQTTTGTGGIPGLIAVTKTGEGVVEFDGAAVQIFGVTSIEEGTLRILGGATYGFDTGFTAAVFGLKSNATLEVSGLIVADTIDIASGATLRVLDGGSLNFESANPITYGTGINLAGHGTIRTEAAGPLSVASLGVGDIRHQQKQILRLRAGADQWLDVVLNGSQINAGLFSDGSDNVVLGALDLGTTTNRINLTSLANGIFTLISAQTSPIANASTGFDIYYKGTKLTNGSRLNISATTSNQSVLLSYNATNATATWTGNSGDTWNIADAKWSGAGIGDGKFIFGDIVKFDATKSGDVTVNTGIGAAGMTVSNNYTFTGSSGIELNGQLWSGAANAGADGILVKDGAASTTLTLANATGAGAANQFAGINIKAGTVAAGNAAQLGTALSNIAFSGDVAAGATLKIAGTMALSGKNGNQRLNVESGKTGNLVVDSAGMLAVTDNQAGAANGGVLHVGGGATLNLTANGDILFSGNKAASGGAAYLENGAVMNIEIANGKTVLFGNPNRAAALLDPSLLHADTLGSADTTAIINKNGPGDLLLNGDNSAYLGQLNINQGTVWMNSTATLGGNVAINNAGSIFAASTALGNVTANVGTLLQVGDAMSAIPQVMRVGGTLTLNDATLVLDGFQGSLIYRDVYTDTVETQSLHMTGTNSLDVNFAALSSGVYKFLTVTSGSFMDNSGNFTIPVDTIVHSISSNTITVSGTNPNTGQTTTHYIVTTNTTYRHNMENLLLTSGGESIEGKRFNGFVFAQTLASGTTVYDADGNAFSGTVSVSGTTDAGDRIDTVILSGTDSDSQTPGNVLNLDVIVQNIRSRWTGSVTGAWNSYDANWVDPVGFADDRFIAGDGVHFDSVSDAGYEENRTILIYGGGVTVGEMIVSGTGSYNFIGGAIAGEAFRSNLEDPTMASGALEMNGTGVLTLFNAGNRFGGGILINSGTVIGNTTSLNDNKILVAENAAVIYAQETSDTMLGTISGSGAFMKAGSGTLTLNTINQVSVGHVLVGQGQLVVTTASNALTVAGLLGVGPEASLVFSTTLNAGTLAHSGTIQRTVSGTSNTVGIMPLVGDYVATPGSTLVLNMLREGMGEDSLSIIGNAVGETRIVLNISGTYTRSHRPAAKRDVRLIVATGVNQLQLTNPLGVSFYDSGTAGIGTEYSFVQGRKGTIFLRNHDTLPMDVNLPMIGASPIVSDLLGHAVINSVTERINARHEQVNKGLMTWTSYARTDDHVRDGFYHDTDLRSDTYQLGAEYVLSDPDLPGFGQLTAGLSYAYSSGKATRDNGSTLDAESHTINAYGSWRKGAFYANAIVNYSPISEFDAVTTDELDSDGTVDGDRLSASLELGGIFDIERGGQIEPYIHALWQQNSFDEISRPGQEYSFDDPNSPNGRSYSFSDFSTLRGLAGIRWSFRYNPSEKFALKPWLGAGFGYATDDSYDIIVGTQSVAKDLGGEYYKFSGGFSALWAFGLEAYASCHWTKGTATTNLTLLGGINYRW